MGYAVLSYLSLIPVVLAACPLTVYSAVGPISLHHFPPNQLQGSWEKDETKPVWLLALPFPRALGQVRCRIQLVSREGAPVALLLHPAKLRVALAPPPDFLAACPVN